MTLEEQLRAELPNKIDVSAVYDLDREDPIASFKFLNDAKDIRQEPVEGWIRRVLAYHQTLKSIPTDIAPNLFPLAVAYAQNQKKRMRMPLVHMIPYCVGITKDLTCHKILFGKEKSVEISPGDKFFLEHMHRLGPESQEYMYDMIVVRQKPAENLTAQIVDRLAIVAGSRITTAEAMVGRMHRHYANRYARALLRDRDSLPASELPGDYKQRWPVFSADVSNLYAFVFIICCLQDISADFLLLQDYSDIAVWEGKPLSELDRYYLSAYLSASTKCRQDVNRLLISAAANSFYEFPII